MARWRLAEILSEQSTKEDKRDKLLRVAHVAKRLGVSPRTVRYWAEVGELKGFKIGHREWRFREQDIVEYQERAVIATDFPQSGAKLRGNHINIKVVPVTKADLDKIPEPELAFYVHIGHIRNELLIIEKFLVCTLNNPRGDVLSEVNVSQQLVILRLLTGKVWEGWQLLQRTDILSSVEKKLGPKARATLSGLKQYFSQQDNIGRMIRNRFAFHYDPSLIKGQLAQVEDTDQLAIYLAEKSVNCFYQFAEAIADSAMLNAVGKGDYEAALRKFTEEAMQVTRLFIAFSDGCLDYVIENHLLSAESKAVDIAAPKRDEVSLPFFLV
jgi:excisionase family DNA binding protein